jgi:hypothetical protein
MGLTAAEKVLHALASKSSCSTCLILQLTLLELVPVVWLLLELPGPMHAGVVHAQSDHQ